MKNIHIKLDLFYADITVKLLVSFIPNKDISK